MSMEWVRARVLENQAKLRDLLAPSDSNQCLQSTMTHPVELTLWLEPAKQPTEHSTGRASDESCAV